MRFSSLPVATDSIVHFDAGTAVVAAADMMVFAPSRRMHNLIRSVKTVGSYTFCRKPTPGLQNATQTETVQRNQQINVRCDSGFAKTFLIHNFAIDRPMVERRPTNRE